MLSKSELDLYCEAAVKFVKDRMGGQLLGAYLFGSYHKGTPNKGSDVDVLFVLTDDNDYSYLHFNEEFHHHLHDQFNVTLHPVYVTQKEYEDGQDPEIQSFRDNSVIYQA